MTPRPPEAVYVRKEGDAFVVGFLNVPQERIPHRRFAERDKALRLAEALTQITGGELIINIEEPLQ